MDLVVSKIKDARGVRVEDLISALAAIAAERCIEAAGNFDPREHSFKPGSRVLSDDVNELLAGSGSAITIDALPGSSIFGTLRDELLHRGYPLAEFPDPKAVFEAFAANIGKPADWGKVPLSIDPDNYPFLMPLQAAYEMRAAVDTVLAPLGPDPRARLSASVLALAEALVLVTNAIDHRVVLRLAFETLHGMAKTAPMTDAAMRELQSQSP